MEYEGDPKLFLTKDGAEIRYEKGQPEMESGEENNILISLFTKKGWSGNVFLPKENRIGSDFESSCTGSITPAMLVNIEEAAERSLRGKKINNIKCSVINTRNDELRIKIDIMQKSVFDLTRARGHWQN